MFFEILCIYVASVRVFAAPPTDVVPLEKQQPIIPIVAQSEELEANGTFKFSYETANGIKREETSYDKVLPNARSGKSSTENGEDKSDESNEIHVQQGSYSYTAPDGTVITVRYIADENGFRPIGDHLPKPPSIPIASPARISGQKAKTSDNAEGSSAPVAVIAAPNEAPKSPKALKVKSRIAEPSSAEQALSPTSESQDSITTPEVSLTTQGPSVEEPIPTTESVSTTSESVSTTTESATTTAELVSTTTESATITAEPASTTTESATTTAEPASTTTESVSTTAESASTTTGSATTTTESASTTTEKSSSTEVTSTDQPTTTEVEFSPKASAKPSNSEEPAASLADFTP